MLKLNKILILSFVLFFSLIVTLLLFKPHRQISLENLHLPKLQKGDLVFRKDLDSQSLEISKLSQNSYSHIGMITSTNPLLVIHSSGTSKQNEQIVLSSFQDFINSSTQIAIKRPKYSEKTKEKIIDSLYENIGKNNNYKIKDNGLYCTLFLKENISKFTNFNPKYTKINNSIIDGLFLFPKAFYDDNQSVLIYEKKLKN